MYLFLLCILPLFSVALYNNNTAYAGVWLSGAAYCDMNTYPTFSISGPATGFQYYETLYDKKTDLQGYSGILSNTKQIFVVFRGSSSFQNWVDDAEALLTPYETFPDCNCKVHTGFYKSTQNIYPNVYSTVNDMLDIYPSYEVIITGHSYGAAVAQLISMELLADNITSYLYNYGQPRVGNKDYAFFVNAYLEQFWRFTHYKDMIPHVPPISGLHYYHSCLEVYQDNDNNFHICSETDGEDPSCSAQFSLYQTNTNNHHVYLNHPLDCSISTK